MRQIQRSIPRLDIGHISVTWKHLPWTLSGPQVVASTWPVRPPEGFNLNTDLVEDEAGNNHMRAGRGQPRREEQA